jgi:hypothetical protein
MIDPDVVKLVDVVVPPTFKVDPLNVKFADPPSAFVEVEYRI